MAGHTSLHPRLPESNAKGHVLRCPEVLVDPSSSDLEPGLVVARRQRGKRRRGEAESRLLLSSEIAWGLGSFDLSIHTAFRKPSPWLTTKMISSMKRTTSPSKMDEVKFPLLSANKLHANSDTAARLVHAGYAVHGIDQEGHGKSSGSKGYISSFGDIVKDCSDYFKSVCEKPENKTKKRFLYGFSMGGTVALQVHRKDSMYWDGAVLLAPMVKLGDGMRPHPVVVSALKMICAVVPSWRVIPAPDQLDKVCKDPQFKKEIRSNPYMYKGNMALQTGHELLAVSLDIEKNMHEVTLPFLVLQGEDDVVADPEGSRLLHERASSRDKTLKLYPGMWHVLMAEPPVDVERIFTDVISWLEERAASAGR
ncbi:unnamed protein product [Triticum turgidum subsp. durum]|uniref:Serine aminopeptidase S33 domain-containing protein n=1 Tax=Triticum turgidum subsp. durum TaxID=4567 RepID=A0A9R0VQA2_TRITD|nr:unnamed protein product [Triticum turgidum subsp. durum]